MPLFKEEKYNVMGAMHKVRYNVDENGMFWCTIKPDMVQATGLNPKETAPTYKVLENKISEAIYKWKETKTVRSYYIKYRLCLSASVQRKISSDLMNRTDVDMWKKTSRLGSEYQPDDHTCLIFDWVPILREVEGELEHEHVIVIATDETYNMRHTMSAIEKCESPHAFYTDSLVKPFESVGDDTLFEISETYWNFNDSYYLEIPLTPDTWKFFNHVDDTLIKLINGMLGFLSADSDKLMANISNMIQSGSMNLIGKLNDKK